MKRIPPVIYEDDSVIVFDKPSGLLIAPDRWDKTRENLMDLIHEKISREIFNVHRIDKDTSGIILCSKNKRVLDFLSGQFQSKTVRKEYIAITFGVPAEQKGLIDIPLAEDEENPGRMKARRKDGKPSETEYEVIEGFRAFSLVLAKPRTGRTHQIRVHLAHIGCPVLNDPFYGDGKSLYLSDIKRGYKRTGEEERPLIGRLALHASRIVFQHPETKQELEVSSPLPHDFDVALKYLRKFGR